MSSACQAAPTLEHDGIAGGERWAGSVEGEVQINEYDSEEEEIVAMTFSI